MACAKHFGQHLGSLPQQPQLVVRVLIPAKSVGLIVGKHGQFFQYVKHISGIETMHLQNFEQMVQSERVLTLSAPTMTPLRTALHMILTRLQQTQMSELDFVQWVIPQAKTGLVVGKNGQTIKKINELTKAWVKIANQEEPTPYAGGRSIYIRGEEDHVKQACDMIQAIAGGCAVSFTVVPMNSVEYVTAGNLPCRVDYPLVTGNATATIHTTHVDVVKSRLKEWWTRQEKEQPPMNLVILSLSHRLLPGINCIRRDAESCGLVGSLNNIVQNIFPFCCSSTSSLVGIQGRFSVTPFLC